MTKAAESDCLSAIEKPHRGTAAPRPHARCSETAPAPRRLIFQLIGRGKDALVEATRRLGDTPYAGIDLNFGCSAPQIRGRAPASRGPVTTHAPRSSRQRFAERFRRTSRSRSNCGSPTMENRSTALNWRAARPTRESTSSRCIRAE